jgi:ketosteroid isomerase-like protein
LLQPKVQRHGTVALLTFNLVNDRREADGAERQVVAWNATEVYGRVDGQWRIIHSHWSYVRPDLKQPLG